MSDTWLQFHVGMISLLSVRHCDKTDPSKKKNPAQVIPNGQSYLPSITCTSVLHKKVAWPMRNEIPSNSFLPSMWMLPCSQARIKIRVVCSRAYHALFMHNMLIRPSREELEHFGEPDFIIFNAGECKANSHVEGITSDASVGISLKHNQMVILGTEYAGEMKKGVFRWGPA